MKYFKSEKSFWLYNAGLALLGFVLLLLKSFLDWNFFTFLLVAIIVIGLFSFRPIFYQVKLMKRGNH